MVDWGNVVGFVNGHGGVDDVSLDDLLVKNGLNVLVDVVMNPL